MLKEWKLFAAITVVGFLLLYYADRWHQCWRLGGSWVVISCQVSIEKKTK